MEELPIIIEFPSSTVAIVSSHGLDRERFEIVRSKLRDAVDDLPILNFEAYGMRICIEFESEDERYLDCIVNTVTELSLLWADLISVEDGGSCSSCVN